MYTFLLTKVNRRRTVIQVLMDKIPGLEAHLSASLLPLVKQEPFSSIRLHLCGPGGAGKSTLRHNIKGNLTSLREHQSKSFSASRTKGVEIDQSITLNDGFLPFLRTSVLVDLFDHGGQQEFHVTYSNLLSHPMSLFLVVLPVFYAKGEYHGVSSAESVVADLKHWLSLLSSLVHPDSSQILVVLNSFQPSSGGNKVAEKALFQSIFDAVTIMVTVFSQEPEFGTKLQTHVIDVNCVHKECKGKLITHIQAAFKTLLESTDQLVPSITKSVRMDLRDLRLSLKQGASPIVPVHTVREHLRKKSATAQLSDDLLDVLLGYCEQLGSVLLLNETEVKEGQTVTRPKLVILDPNWFCCDVVGTLFEYEHSLSNRGERNDVIKDSASLRSWFETKVNARSVDAEVLRMLPELLHRMGLCLPLPSPNGEFWITSFLELQSSTTAPGGGDASSRENEQQSLETPMNGMWWHLSSLKKRFPTTYRCAGRYVSLPDLLGSARKDVWQLFVPGTFSRFQMLVGRRFWSSNADTNVTCNLQPLWVDVQYSGVEGQALVCVQMIRDWTRKQVGCRFWCIASHEAAVQKLMDFSESLLPAQGAGHATHLPLHSLSSPPSRKEEADRGVTSTIDLALSIFINWFLEASKVNDRGPTLHTYCIDAHAAGQPHAQTMSSVPTISLTYFDYPQCRARFEEVNVEKAVEVTEENQAIFRLLGPNAVDLAALKVKRHQKLWQEQQQRATRTNEANAEELKGEDNHHPESDSEPAAEPNMPTSTTTPLSTERSSSLIIAKLDEMNLRIQQVDSRVAAGVELTKASVTDELGMPRVFLLLKAPHTMGRFIRKLCRPSRFLMDKYYLFFVCPVTRQVCDTNHGKGYSIEFPPHWISEYGPAIQSSLKLCRLLSTPVCNYFSIPNPLVYLEADMAKCFQWEAIDGFLEELEVAMAPVPVTTSTASSRTPTGPPPSSSTSALSSSSSSMRSTQQKKAPLIGGMSLWPSSSSPLPSLLPLSVPLSPFSPASSSSTNNREGLTTPSPHLSTTTPPVTAPNTPIVATTGSAYRALQELITRTANDPVLQRSGLECVISHTTLGEDTAVEWVSPEGRERFMREGKRALFWNQELGK